MPATRILLLLITVLPLVGCGDGLAKVNGKVTLDGQPVTGGTQMYGTVNFYPANGNGVPAVGVIDEAGRYKLMSGSRKGTEPGTYLVSIAMNKITLPTKPSEMPQPKLVTPKKYASMTESGLRAEIKAGSNMLDFDLSSNPAK